jgi:hypothetical protein
MKSVENEAKNSLKSDGEFCFEKREKRGKERRYFSDEYLLLQYPEISPQNQEHPLL